MDKAELRPRLYIYPDNKTLIQAAADHITNKIKKVLGEKDIFSMALAGGNTPKGLYDLLGTRYPKKMPWRQIHLFIGDERYLPKDHPDSNFNMIRKSLLSKIPLPPQNFNPIQTEIKPIEKAAKAYEERVKIFFGIKKGSKGVMPQFDLMLLGLGNDGHTASLFLESGALKDKEHIVLPSLAPPDFPAPNRITFTLPVISNAKEIMFLISGKAKQDIVKSILEEPEKAAKRYPAAMVLHTGRVSWFIDSEAFNRTRLRIDENTKKE